jgi:hypothetical protein
MEPRVSTASLKTDTPEGLVTPATEETRDALVLLVPKENVEIKGLR